MSVFISLFLMSCPQLYVINCSIEVQYNQVGNDRAMSNRMTAPIAFGSIRRFLFRPGLLCRVVRNLTRKQTCTCILALVAGDSCLKDDAADADDALDGDGPGVVVAGEGLHADHLLNHSHSTKKFIH